MKKILFLCDPKTEIEAQQMLQDVVDFLNQRGYVPTVSQQSIKPLAMRNIINICEVRRKFTRYE